jgi:uncharacterized protein
MQAKSRAAGTIHRRYGYRRQGAHDLAAHLVGIISDTHGLLRPEAEAALQGSDLIIHAGDIGEPTVLAGLRALAPVRAVRGNIDNGPWALNLPAAEVVEVGGVYLYVLHNVHDLDLDPAAGGFKVVVCGHSHRAGIEWRGSVLYVNPGSAGRRRFSLPVSLARLHLADGMVDAELIELAV